MQRRRILSPPGRSSISGSGGGRYCPRKMAALSEFPSTPDTCIRLEESIRDMPLSTSGCGIDNNLTDDGHNAVGAISHKCSHLLAISAQIHHIIDPGRFLTGGLPATRRGDRGAVPLHDHSPSTASSPLQTTSLESGYRGGVYGDNIISQKISLDASSNPNKWSHSWATRNTKKTKK